MKNLGWAIVVLVAGCANGLTSGPEGSAHDEVSCGTAWQNPPTPVCEAACIDVSSASQDKKCNGATNALVTGTVACSWTVEVEGARGCCAAIGSIAQDGRYTQTAERFFECP